MLTLFQLRELCHWAMTFKLVEGPPNYVTGDVFPSVIWPVNTNLNYVIKVMTLTAIKHNPYS